jgi:hypothetical protein
VSGWVKQLAGTVLVLLFAFGIGGFVLILRAQQQVGLSASMAAANIRAVSPPDGATSVPVEGEIRADYLSRPSSDPAIKFEPTPGVTLDNAHWDGTTFVVHYQGLRNNSLYHAELDQDDLAGKGEHKQIKVRWSFRTGSLLVTTPTPSTTTMISISPTITAKPTSPPSPPTAPDRMWYTDQTPGTVGGHIGLDWNGQRVKTIKHVGTTQSPDGRWIYNAMTPSNEVFDASGTLAASLGGQPSMWADDSRQFCGISPQSGSLPSNLVTMALDGSLHTVAAIALPDSPTKLVKELALAACSDLNGRAVVVGGSNGYIWSMAVVSLRDGSVIYQRRYPNPVTHVVASHDGQYLAEQVGSNANGSPSTLIRELPSGNVLGQVTGMVVGGFSWDGSLVAGAIQGNSGLVGAEVIHWQTNHVVWNGCSCPSPFAVHVIAQPEGTKLAIAATNQNRGGTFTIVDANGGTLSPAVGNQIFEPLF